VAVAEPKGEAYLAWLERAKAGWSLIDECLNNIVRENITSRALSLTDTGAGFLTS
jgi:hypothetical protein